MGCGPPPLSRDLWRCSLFSFGLSQRRHLAVFLAMAFRRRALVSFCVLVLVVCFPEVMFHLPIIRSEVLDFSSLMAPVTKGIHRFANGYRSLQGCKDCRAQQGIGITTAYTDAAGTVKTRTIHSKDLSSSWIWKNPDENYEMQGDGPGRKASFQTNMSRAEGHNNSTADLLKHIRQTNMSRAEGHDDSAAELLELIHQRRKGSSQSNKIRAEDHHNSTALPPKHIRQELRKIRKLERVAALLDQSKYVQYQMQKEAIARSKDFQNRFNRIYTIWRKDDGKRKTVSTLKLMKNQIIIAKAYALIAHSKKETDLYDSLMKCIKESRSAIGEADSDVELTPGAVEKAKALGGVLLMAKAKLHDCIVLTKKLRAMLQHQEENEIAVKRQSMFLMQPASQTVPVSLHCLSLLLTTDYFLHDYSSNDVLDTKKLEDPSLYHYVIISDNVLATSVVVNSTTLHVKEPEKHVFHIVTDRLNFAAMKMWFFVNSPPGATIHVENMDDFKWLNSSYCPVLHQLEDQRIKEYYFRSVHPSSLSVGDENLKYKNPKYLSMLNHLRFYIPEVYPKLDKILFLDDDVVVQKDLTPLWSIDMKGKVNAAVETCKGSFHQYDTYLNFSNAIIAKNFDPRACGWAFGMNIFDLKAWKNQNITSIYHYWQELNVEQTLWKLGTLPPGLMTFYNLTHILDHSWHVLGLGYASGVKIQEVERAAVIHYNGNYKPWLELAILQFRKYWSKFVRLDNPYLRKCHVALE